MNRDHQQIWVGLGGVMLSVGAAGMIAVAVVPAEAPQARLWHQGWFLFLVTLCGVLILLGAYAVVAALFKEWPLPSLRDADAQAKPSAIRQPRKPRDVEERRAGSPSGERPAPSLASAPATAPRSWARLAAAAGNAEPSDARSLIRRGEGLLAEVKRLRRPVDPHTARYQPEMSLSRNLARASRYWMGSPQMTGEWLADVSRFVSEQAPKSAPEVYPNAVRSLAAEQEAIEQNLSVLRKIDKLVDQTDDPLPTLRELRQEGVDLLNAAIRGRTFEDESLAERAVESWSSKVRDKLQAQYPDWAYAHFVVRPAGARSPKATLHMRVQRLTQIVQKIESGETS